MDKYAFLIFLLAPGFIASTAATFCGNFSDKHNEFGYVMRYFSYSFFTVAVLIVALYMMGIVWADDTLDTISTRMTYITNIITCIAVSTVISVRTGAIWSLWLRERLLNMCNYIQYKLTGRRTVIEPRIIDGVFKSSGKQGYVLLEVIKNNTSTVGFLHQISSSNSERLELSLWSAEKYKGWLGTDKCPLIKTYMDIDNDMIIKEYDYPAEWVG